MNKRFPEYKKLDLSEVNKQVLAWWKKEDTFHQSISNRENGKGNFIFYEGPPSANGMPGIHHVISRTIKDIVCRYKTLRGYKVERKAGWDTHGLPVELGVESLLGITKDDIGKKISIREYNDTCKREVMKYTREWEELTARMGYWVDMQNPYITYDNRYIETIWYLLKELFDKEMLYKGYSIQPYSPAAGTGLSTHELNQPGCYRDVKDTTVVAQFEAVKNNRSAFLFDVTDTPVYFLAWTTTPWTLPSNTALAVGPAIDYVLVRTFNPYSFTPVSVILAKELFQVYFSEKNKEIAIEDYHPGDKYIPYKILHHFNGKDLQGIVYNQLIDWVKPQGDAFRVVVGDFITTEDGTGIVHIAPTFGADDFRVAQQNNIAPLTVVDAEGQINPLVDRKGRFYPLTSLDPQFAAQYVNAEIYNSFNGRFVKNEYDDALSPEDPTVDVDIAVYLKKANKAFKIEKHIHTYPHCWRTDKPVLYYPLDSWFIRTTAVKERLIELNDTIKWKPASTGTGRFGKWLENLVDWNLSRSRYWGTPLPIWISDDKQEIKCVGSVAELKNEIEKAVMAGLMKENPLKDYKSGDYSAGNYTSFDLHRPFVDEIVLVSATGQSMHRETDLIDVWFDSGAMPYAQAHYPFASGKDKLAGHFPADFIAEGVDQTRGWFFTLHTLATMLFDSVAFRSIISNGLVLDKNGNKMSKRLGNAIDPFATIEKNGSDPLRWYMITNAQPWDNLKFDPEGVEEVKRKFFGTLYNSYSFFALYANVDGFRYQEAEVPYAKRPEIDRWIISLLHSLIEEVTTYYENLEPTRAARAIQNFVIENLSNWYVRLNRKRYWGGEYNDDKVSAFQTLYTCLENIAILTSPIIPFYSDKLFRDLNSVTSRYAVDSVHLSDFPVADPSLRDKALEERMDIAQKVTSMILGLRRKVNIKVRQPLHKIMVPVSEEGFEEKFRAVQELILSEVNVKEVEFLKESANMLVKKIKPDFKTLGPRYGKHMKEIAARLAAFTQEEINLFENSGSFQLDLNNQKVELLSNDVEITSDDIPGWLVAAEGKLAVALDITITPQLRQEGIARELVNRIQNIRKESNFEVTDKVLIEIAKHEQINDAVLAYEGYIKSQTLAIDIQMVNNIYGPSVKAVEIEEGISTSIMVKKII